MATKVLEVRPADLVAFYYYRGSVGFNEPIWLWRAYITWDGLKVEAAVNDPHLKLYLVVESPQPNQKVWSLYDQYGRLHTSRV